MSRLLHLLEQIAETTRSIDGKLTTLLGLAHKGMPTVASGTAAPVAAPWAATAEGDMTVRQVADRLGASTTTIYRLCESGKLPSYRLGVGRGAIRVREADLQKFTEGAKASPLRAEPPPPPVRLKHLKV